MKYTFLVGFHNSNKIERVESNYLPEYKKDKTGEFWLYILGKECGMYYYGCEAYIKAMYEEI